MKILVIDPSLTGISGDMLLSALIDLTGRIELLREVAEKIVEIVEYCEKLDVKVLDVKKKGIRAKYVKAEIKENVEEVKALDVKVNAKKVMDKLDFSNRAEKLGIKAIDELIEAEVKIHGTTVEKAHLHELASVDTLLDIIGTIHILDSEGFLTNSKIYSKPIAVGSGKIRIMHGVMPVPAPATLEILRRNRMKICNSNIKSELTTPTGAALLAAIVDEMIDSLPNMRITRTGYGAGAKDFPETPNILRVMEGEKSGNFRETVYVLETNIDDSSGEVMGYLVEKLLNEGALDVTIIPAIGKKNRPVNIVKVIAEADKHLSIANMIIRETGTLGVRVTRTERVKVSRKIKELPVRIGGREFKVRVKISRGVEDEIINIKPEFEDVKRLAAAVKLPIREVMKRISCKLMEDLL